MEYLLDHDVKVLQWDTLNVITFGLTITDNINQMKTINKELVDKTRYTRV